MTCGNLHDSVYEQLVCVLARSIRPKLDFVGGGEVSSTAQGTSMRIPTAVFEALACRFQASGEEDTQVEGSEAVIFEESDVMEFTQWR